MCHSLCTVRPKDCTCGEKLRLGGTCLNGMNTSKALLHSTEVFHELKEHASAHGIIRKELEHDLSALMKKRMELLTSLGKAYCPGQQKRSYLSGGHSPHYWKW